MFPYQGGGVPAVMTLKFNARLQNNGTVPMIDVPAGKTFAFALLLNSYFSSGAAPIINLGAGATCILGIQGNFDTAPNTISGPVGSNLFYTVVDGGPNTPLSAQPGFLGNQVQYLTTGVSCTTATRPINPFSLPGDLQIGTMVFDQSLGASGKPIWWDGTQWVDATGTPA